MEAIKQYTESIAAYQRALQLIGKVKHVDQQILDILKARSYHGLGYVAQEQRQWEEAEQYYQQALQIYIKNNDLKSGSDLPSVGHGGRGAAAVGAGGAVLPASLAD